MPDTVTPKLGLVKPEVGASADSWGNKLNSNFDIIDLKAVRNTIQWTMTLGDDNPSSATGHFLVKRFNNAGIEITPVPLTIERQSGNAIFGNSIIVAGVTAANGTLSVQGAATFASTVNVTGATTIGSISGSGATFSSLTLNGNGSFTGTWSGATISITGTITANLFSGAGVSVTGNISAGGAIGATGNVSGGSFSTTGTLQVNGNINSGSLSTGNITGAAINGSSLGVSGTASANALNANSMILNGVVNASTSGFNMSVGINSNLTVGGLNGANGSNSLVVQAAAEGHAYMSFLVQGQFGANFGMFNDGNLYLGGFTHGGNFYRVYTTREAVVVNARITDIIDVQITGSQQLPYGNGQVMMSMSRADPDAPIFFRIGRLQVNINGTWTNIG